MLCHVVSCHGFIVITVILMFPAKSVHLPSLHAASGQIFASGFKAAGVGAQQSSAAAAAFLLQDSEHEWSHIDLCWVGPFANFQRHTFELLSSVWEKHKNDIE